MKLDIKAAGLAAGIVWAASVFIVGIVAMLTDYCAGMVAALGTVYIGYGESVLGSIIGAVWGFFDAGIGAVVLVWLYNKFAK